MALLRVRLRGKTVSEIDLKPEQTYMAGRKEDCEILLQAEKGISREHFQVYFEDQQWKLKVISRFGEVLMAGEKVTEWTFSENQIFMVPPYEFVFEIQAQGPVATPVVYEAAEIPSPSFSNPPANISVPSTPINLEEKTVVQGLSSLVPVLKFVDDQQNVKETIQLDKGSVFVAGRASSCQILLNDQRVSSKQFEIRRVDAQYVIMDQNSRNGTSVNGQPIEPLKAVVLNSGDVIKVLDHQMVFELFDPRFQNLVQQASALLPVENQWPAQPEYQVPAAHQGYNQMPQMPPPLATQDQKKKYMIRVAIGALALILVLGGLFNTGGENENPPSKVKSNDPLAKLNPEQVRLVKHHYSLAENYLAQQKWNLAKDEIERLKQILPGYQSYERAKEIETMALQGIETIRQMDDIDARERMKKEQEERVRIVVEGCKKLLTPEVTADKMENCLQPALMLNPADAGIQLLQSQVQQMETGRAMKKAQEQENDRLASQLKGLFSKAESEEKSGDLLSALKFYDMVQKSSLPDRASYKSRAQRQIATIRGNINSQISSLMSESEKLGKEQQFKQAILSLRKARKVDPGNSTIEEKIGDYTLELKKQMQVIFQEGVLEENFGNIEGAEGRPGAKDKWKKVLELDIPDGEYYLKAKQRLKKYGAI